MDLAREFKDLEPTRCASLICPLTPPFLLDTSADKLLMFLRTLRRMGLQESICYRF